MSMMRRIVPFPSGDEIPLRVAMLSGAFVGAGDDSVRQRLITRQPGRWGAVPMAVAGASS
jgi:hypothetical protein